MEEVVLNNKIIPPYVRRHFIERKEVTEKLKNYHLYPLTLVHAGPGFGKSITVSMFLQTIQQPVAWYNMDEDEETFHFMKYMIYAIREKIASFGNVCLKKMNDSAYQATEEENLSVWFSFLNALSQLTSPLVMVLDDIHFIQNHQEIRKLFELLIRHLPKKIHLFLISRNIPPGKELSTMMIKHQILEISQKDLSFSLGEISGLFVESYKYPMDQEDLSRIFEKTEGWVIAIQMIWQGLVRDLTLDQMWKSPSLTMDSFFQYLATEIMERLPVHIQNFIRKTSVLSSLHIEACKYLLPEENIEDILKYLHKQNLFIQALSNQQIRYHTLFQDYILSTLTEEEKIALHRQIYGYYEQAGNIEEALRHVKQLRSIKELALFLNKYGTELLKQGKLEILQDLLSETGEKVKDQYPLLWILQADIDRLRCKYEESIKNYQKSRKESYHINNKKSYIRSLAGEARVYLDTVQPSKAESLLKEALRLSHRERSEEVADLYTLYSENQLNLGNIKVAEKLYRLSLKQQHEESLGNIEARLHLRTGRITQALQILEQKLLIEEKSNISINVRSHRETSVLLSIIFSFIGEGEKAEKTARQGIIVGQKMKSPFVEAVGWMRLAHSMQLLNPGDHQLIIESYEKSLKIMDELGVEKGKVESLMGLCLFYGFIGELDIALHYGEKGIHIAELVKDKWFANIIHLSIGIIYTHHEKFPLAKQKLMLAYQGLSSLGDQFSTTVIWMWLAYIAYQEKSWENFEIYAKQFLYYMNQGRYHFLIQRPSLFGPRDLLNFAPYLIEIKRRRLDSQGIVTNWLLEKGWLSLEFHPGYTLRIQMFGKFRVWLGEREIKEKEWQREKAKILFQLLVMRRNELLSKKWIQEILWPDYLEEQANRDFKVALNALNRALEPNRPNNTPTFFIQRHANSYAFNLASSYILDVEIFEQNVMHGLNEENDTLAYSYLQKGLSVYKGDFLPEQLSDDWTIEERERLKLLFQRGAEKMARIELERQNYSSALSWGERIIALDPTWEEAYRIMMLASIEEGNRSLAIKLFQKCKKILREEIGVDPMPELVQIYESLL